MSKMNTPSGVVSVTAPEYNYPSTTHTTGAATMTTPTDTSISSSTLNELHTTLTAIHQWVDYHKHNAHRGLDQYDIDVIYEYAQTLAFLFDKNIAMPARVMAVTPEEIAKVRDARAVLGYRELSDRELAVLIADKKGL